MAIPNLKVRNPNEGTENPTPTPSMDKPKTVATALEEIYYRLGGAGTVPSGTDVATLTWAISELVGEGGSSGGAWYIPIIVNETETQYIYSLGGYTYNHIADAVSNGKSVYATLYSEEHGGTSVFVLFGYAPVKDKTPCVVMFHGDTNFRFTATTNDMILTYKESKGS